VPDHVFTYGSLVTRAARRATLRGHRRVWGVAMDNRAAVPGYKVYEEPDGSRPPVHVAFLDLEPAGRGDAVNGALLPVDAAALAALDERERQYERVEVTAAVAPVAGGGVGGRVWAYMGRRTGRARVDLGRRGGAAVVIQRAYLELVDRAFRALGADEHARFRASTEPPPFPVRELARVDLPG
jgi:gamma-glutamylcyclotransferase (GGCT)/AIG2-like uncharacterized protein YtfP